jgi:hypothetical protein
MGDRTAKEKDWIPGYARIVCESLLAGHEKIEPKAPTRAFRSIFTGSLDNITRNVIILMLAPLPAE